MREVIFKIVPLASKRELDNFSISNPEYAEFRRKVLGSRQIPKFNGLIYGRDGRLINGHWEKYRIECVQPRDVFYENTVADFQIAKAPEREPDYVSASGSEYWYFPDGVFRRSDHWGKGIATCDWYLNGVNLNEWNEQRVCYRFVDKSVFEQGYINLTEMNEWEKQLKEKQIIFPTEKLTGFCRWDNFHVKA